MSDSIKKYNELVEEGVIDPNKPTRLESKMQKIEALTHEINNVGQTVKSKMKIEDWRTYGEVQYLKGRLDELNKVDNLLHLDMSSMRIIDARISKYLDKLQRVSPLAFELYHIEKENIKYTLQRENNKAKTNQIDSKRT